MLLNLFVTVTVLYLAGLGFFLFLQPHKKRSDFAFIVLSFLAILWVIANFIGTNYKTYSISEYFIRTDLILGPLLSFSILFFVQQYIKDKTKALFNAGLSIILIIIFALSLVTSIYSVSSNIASISFNGAENEVTYGNAFIVYSIVQGVPGLIALALLIWNIKLIRNKFLQRQLKNQLTGLSTAFLLGAVTNLLIPQLTDNQDIIRWSGNLTYFGFAFFITLTSYSIFRHKLFDIKFIVLRTMGYLFALGTLVVVFAFVSSFLISSEFVQNSNFSVPIIIRVAVLSIAVLVYPSLKRYFDKITNKFFFRDTYEPEEFLDALNKNIVGNIEIGILLRRTTQIIQDNLKCRYCSFLLHATDNEPMRLVGNDTKISLSKIELKTIDTELSKTNKRIIKRDALEDPSSVLRKLFTKKDIDFVVQLKANSYGDSETIAYVIFGPKSSGNLYNDADYKIIDIIADELVIAIQNALRFEEIQEFNVTLQKKVNDATSKLRKTNEKLKAMDETKDEFISMASHQLRTPLTSVKGYLSMVLEGDAGEINENQKKLLDQAFVSSQRMVYLIADLLNVSRLRTGKFVIDAHPTNLADVVEQEIAQIKEQAKSKSQELVFIRPDNFSINLLDETKIRQVIMNFVDNALFYTPNGGKITIELSEDKYNIYFMVKDNGIGIPKADQQFMFTKFYRAKNARSARPDGTGLGLFMAKKIITAQGGDVLFESTQGRGSTFGFSFNKKHLANQINDSHTAQISGSEVVEVPNG